ncbi:ankyrin repeat domain-containing protein [Hymenobacter defluvii]|uniref:Ankyrin repeat domain-containing protein n=1 Tax=Hymenobacter defluvii TaxID=2054411 RepID=A0ABS3TIA9_9BACT|nr:ankyrin repeat domain-containing protein [Hymenobacter defluvii]MBO3272324.1 ankyrin repeat domain-containing protein [Hymenobacter defluvii]
MTLHPILLVGGSGTVGRWAARLLHDAHPTVPLLLGGRDLAKAQEAAAEIPSAEGIVLDLAAEDFGLGQRLVSAVVVFFTDDRLAALGFAQARGLPYLSISAGIFEMGPEVAAYMHQPQAAPVVLGTEWLVGATTVPTLEFTQAFGRVHAITIGALLDEQDVTGPAAYADFARQTKIMPAALVRREGAFVWQVGDEGNTTFHAVDGTEQQAAAFSFYDVLGLATATGAPNVQFSLAFGVSSTRRQGEPMSTEILIDLAGEDHAGQPLRTRHAVVHPQGQMPLTGLGVALLLERLLGLDGQPAVPAGLYFPYQLLEPRTYLARLQQIGGRVLTLAVPPEPELPHVSHRPQPRDGSSAVVPLPVYPRTDLTLDAAIRAGNLPAVLEQLRARADVNRPGPDGLTPLMLAAGLGEFHLTQLLLTAGANVHAVEPRMGATALHKAVQAGNPDVVALLLDHGAFIDQQTPILGNTPLMDAVLHKHAAVVERLLQRGARMTIVNHWGQTALDIARADGLPGITRCLEAQQQANADAVARLKLVAAVKAADRREVERLIAANHPVDEQVPMIGSLDDNYTPLGIAAREGQIDIARLLLHAGADPRRLIGLMGGMALHDATYFGHAAIVRLLTQHPEQPGAPAAGLQVQGAYNGYAALHDAVWHGYLDVAQALVEAGAYLDQQSHTGLTPQGLARLYGYDKLVQLLVKAER